MSDITAVTVPGMTPLSSLAMLVVLGIFAWALATIITETLHKRRDHTENQSPTDHTESSTQEVTHTVNTPVENSSAEDFSTEIHSAPIFLSHAETSDAKNDRKLRLVGSNIERDLPPAQIIVIETSAGPRPIMSASSPTEVYDWARDPQSGLIDANTPTTVVTP